MKAWAPKLMAGVLASVVGSIPFYAPLCLASLVAQGKSHACLAILCAVQLTAVSVPSKPKWCRCSDATDSLCEPSHGTFLGFVMRVQNPRCWNVYTGEFTDTQSELASGIMTMHGSFPVVPFALQTWQCFSK